MVLTEEQFEKCCDLLKLSEQTREIVAKILTYEPVRKVQGTARNLHGSYASKKWVELFSLNLIP